MLKYAHTATLLGKIFSVLQVFCVFSVAAIVVGTYIVLPLTSLDVFRPSKVAAAVEITEHGELHSRTWYNPETNEYRVVSLVGAPLSLETGGVVDASIHRRNDLEFRGWEITQVPIPFSVAESGRVTLNPGGQQVEVTLEQTGWFSEVSQEFSTYSNAPRYDPSRVSFKDYKRQIGPDLQTLQTDVTWRAIWDGLDILWKVSSLGVQEKIIVSSEYRSNMLQSLSQHSDWMAFKFAAKLPDQTQARLETALTQSSLPVLDEEDWVFYGIDDELLAFLPADYAYVDAVSPTGHPQRRHWAKLKRQLLLSEGKTWIIVGLPKADLLSLPEGDIVFDPTWQISSTAHDAYSEEASPWSEITTPAGSVYGKFYLGIDQYTSSTAYWDGGWKFVTSIPQGSTVTAATIALQDNGDNAGSITGDWFGYDVDSVTNFTSDSHRVSDHHTRTTASVAHDYSAITGTITSPDLSTIVQEIVDRGGFGGDIGLTYRSDTSVGDNWQSWIDYTDNSANAAVLDVTYTGAIPILEQEGFRWRDDDGSESTATWLDSQDTSITRATATNTRLRILVDGTNDPVTSPYQLEYKLSSDSQYRQVLTANSFASVSTTSNTNGTSLAGGVSLNMPSGIEAGNLLLLFASNDNTGGTNMAVSGWTPLFNQQYTGNVVSFGAWAKIAAGSDTATLTGASQDYAATVIRVVGHGVTDVSTDIQVGTPATTSTANPNPPSLDAGYSEKWLWIEGFGADDDDGAAGTYVSTNYTAITSVESAQSASSTMIGLGYRQYEAQTEDPGTMAMDAAEEALANLIAIPPFYQQILLAPSANIAASGENTTVQLTAPSGKTTSDFDAGRIQDDENPSDTVDITEDDYTELEWSLTATADTSAGDVYQFRVTANGTPLDTYTVTPTWTIPSSNSSFTLTSYRWFVDSNAETVSDAWGDPDIPEDTKVAILPASNDAPSQADELRLRVAVVIGSSNLSASSQQYKLQYKSGTDAVCTTGSWTDVGASGGGEIWRYATSSVTDGTTLTDMELTVSDVQGVYVKSAPTATNPNGATIGEALEYDFHLEHNGASDANTYSFRVVESDGTELSTYTRCPTLMTNATTAQELRHGNIFADEIEQGFIRAE